MRQKDWDAKEFVQRMIAGDFQISETLADLSPDQLAEVELVLRERLATRETGTFQERMQRDKAQK